MPGRARSCENHRPKASARSRTTRGDASPVTLKPRTRMLYRRQLELDLLPTFGAQPMTMISRHGVEPVDELQVARTARLAGDAREQLLLTIIGHSCEGRTLQAARAGWRRWANRRVSAPSRPRRTRSWTSSRPGCRLGTRSPFSWPYCASNMGSWSSSGVVTWTATDPELAILEISRAMVQPRGTHHRRKAEEWVGHAHSAPCRRTYELIC